MRRLEGRESHHPKACPQPFCCVVQEMTIILSGFGKTARQNAEIMKEGSHITTIPGNEIIVVNGMEGMVECDPKMCWCQCKSFQTQSKQLYAALCWIARCDTKDEIFHRPKRPGHL